MSRILVVDDEPTTSTLAIEYLRLAGFEAVPALDARSALDAIAKGLRPDLIVLDRRLSDLDGLELCARLKADPRLAGVPILMVSVYRTPPAQVPQDRKPDAWLAKPFRPKELVAEIRKMLAAPPA